MQHPCGFDFEQIDILISATKDNGVKIDSLNSSVQTLSVQHKDIIRWLLVVVCFIALGKSALDFAKSVWGHEANAAVIMDKK